MELCSSVALFGHLCILTWTVPLQLVSRVTVRELWRLYKADCWVNSLLSAVCLFRQGHACCESCVAVWREQFYHHNAPGDLWDIAAAMERWRMAEGDARPDELAECRSAEGSWGCKWGCKDQRASLSADFTCLFNQRPRQEASPHNSAVPMATPLLIVAHPLPESFQPRGEVGTFECWRKERRRVCVCVFLSTC